jgi:hypothetical protein
MAAPDPTDVRNNVGWTIQLQQTGTAYSFGYYNPGATKPTIDSAVSLAGTAGPGLID